MIRNLTDDNKETLKNLYANGYKYFDISKLTILFERMAVDLDLNIDIGASSKDRLSMLVELDNYREEYEITNKALPFVRELLIMKLDGIPNKAIKRYLDFETNITRLNGKTNEFHNELNPYMKGLYDNCKFGSKPIKPEPIPEVTNCPKPPVVEEEKKVDPYIFKYYLNPQTGQTMVSGFDWDYINENTGKLPTPVILPSKTPDGTWVNAIWYQAFMDELIGVDVIIPSPIRDIKERTIFRNSAITSITFNDEMIGYIGNNMFQGNSLGVVRIPPKIQTIGSSSFIDAGITKLLLPGETLVEIKASAFENNNITEISLPNSVKIIGSRAFKNNDITKVKLSNSIESVGINAFQDNNIIDFELGSGIVNMSNNMVANNNLRSLIIPPQVKEVNGIYGNLFNELTIPGTVNKVTGISPNLILEKINIRDGVNQLNLGDLGGMPIIKHLRVPDSLKNISLKTGYYYDKKVVYANLLEGDSVDANGNIKIRGVSMDKRFGWILKPLNEFPE